MTRNARAWTFICKLFATPHQHTLGALSRSDRGLLPALQGLRAVHTRAVADPYTRCPHCHRSDVPVRRALADAGGAQDECDCPACGRVPLGDEHSHRYSIDPRWLTAQLRLALGIGIEDPCEELCEGIWQLGWCNGALTVLLRDVQHLVLNFGVFMRLRLRSRGRLCLLAPAQGCEFGAGMMDDEVTLMPLEDRFCLYGERVMRIGHGGAARLAQTEDERRPVFGPFSQDFRWVHLQGWPAGPIALRPAQAAVFRVLWGFKGLPRGAADIMRAAGLSSEKPVDVFKMRRDRRGDPAYEGPLQAYRELVVTEQRRGTYAMPCAAIQAQGRGAAQ